MKLNKVDMLCTKVDLKESKDKVQYLLIGLLDMLSGDTFQISSKDLKFLSSLKPMTKVKVNLNLTSSQYGLKLELVDILETLGTI